MDKQGRREEAGNSGEKVVDTGRESHYPLEAWIHMEGLILTSGLGNLMVAQYISRPGVPVGSFPTRGGIAA